MNATMTAPVGLIANPASGKDIRRLIAHGSVFDNNEKVNIIRRILRALDAFGVRDVLAMPDVFGLVVRAVDQAATSVRVHLVDIEVDNSARDSVTAARVMAAEGACCIVTIGGDGTNRVVSKGCGTVPLVPISTGTNNVFPTMVEGTLAGIAAAALALGVESVRQHAVAQVPRLEVYRNGGLADIALVDVVVYDERFVASRAIWEPQKMRTLVLARAPVGAIGASAIAAFLPEAVSLEGQGLWLELGAPGRVVMAPIAPGLIAPVFVRSFELLGIGERRPLVSAPGVIALDGERELPILEGDHLEVGLSPEGPYVVDIERAVREAVKAGMFVNSAYWDG